MTLSEFKAWFEGFSEGVNGTPTPEQWGKIKARVEKIDGTQTSQHVFYHQYWPYRSPFRWEWNDPYARYGLTSAGGTWTLNNSQTWTADDFKQHETPGFDVTAAMYAAGKAEAGE